MRIGEQQLSRRDFILRMAVSAAALSLPGCSALIRKEAPEPKIAGLILSPTSHRMSSGPLTYFAWYDLEKRIAHKIGMPLRTAHSAFGNPKDRTKVWVAEKAGTKCCEIDLSGRLVLRIIEAGPGRQFYGHGAYSADGKYIYLSEIEVGPQSKGFITIRDNESLKVIGQVESFGDLPHDIHLTDGGNTLVIANQGKNPGPDPAFLGGSITYVDLASGRLLRKIPLGEKNISAAHLALGPAGEVVIGANSYLERRDEKANAVRALLRNPATLAEGIARRIDYEEYFPTPLYVSNKTDELISLSDPEVLKSMKYTLSLSIDSSRGVVAASHVFGGTVSFWSLGTGKFLGSKFFGEERPNGIALTEDGGYFALTTAQDKLYFFNAQSLKLEASLRQGIPFLAGSHITSWHV